VGGQQVEPAEWSPFDPLDLGHGHRLEFFGPSDGQSRPVGAIVIHSLGDLGQTCEGGITFATAPERYRRLADGTERPSWTVESWEPLTLSPSLLCACGDHGWVREGRWVPA
jgi:hypothetical protein